jgi:hypothetical protein
MGWKIRESIDLRQGSSQVVCDDLVSGSLEGIQFQERGIHRFEGRKRMNKKLVARLLIGVLVFILAILVGFFIIDESERLVEKCKEDCGNMESVWNGTCNCIYKETVVRL